MSEHKSQVQVELSDVLSCMCADDKAAFPTRLAKHMAQRIVNADGDMSAAVNVDIDDVVSCMCADCRTAYRDNLANAVAKRLIDDQFTKNLGLL